MLNHESSGSTKKAEKTHYKCYGCVKCQKQHFEDESIYTEHIYLQSKHGIETVTADVRWFKLRTLLASS